MKRLICIILSATMILIAGMSANAMEQSIAINEKDDITVQDVILTVLQSDHEWKTVSTGTGTILIEDAYYINGFKVISAMELDGKITTSIYDEVNRIRYMYVYTDSYVKSTINSIIYQEATNFDLYETEYNKAIDAKKYLLESESYLIDGNYDSRAIGETEETWWSMGIYYNTSSAYKDRYWRMYNPRNNVDHIYFFSYSSDPEHGYATEYMDFIGQMDFLEQTVDGYYGMNVPLALLSFTFATLGAIVNELIDNNMSTDQAENILEIYNLRDKADRRYDMVLDICG